MSRYFSLRVRRQIDARAAGHCECHLVPHFEEFCCHGQPLAPGRSIYEHIDPYELSRNSTLENGAKLRRECAKKKTELDQAVIAKVRHVTAAHSGYAPRRRPMPCGRHSRWKRRIGAFRPEPRVSMRELIAQTRARRAILTQLPEA